jgi:predicted acetyltransferase
MDDERLALVAPAVAFDAPFVEMMDDFDAAGEHTQFRGTDALARTDFPAYVRVLEERARGANLPPGYVPDSQYWLVRDGATVLGVVSLRHYLTPALDDVGGHIGYSIRPSERRKGYGTRVLALALERAAALGLARVLVTCDTDNIGSARIIEKNGGVLASQGYSERTQSTVSRYWIEL